MKEVIAKLKKAGINFTKDDNLKKVKVYGVDKLISEYKEFMKNLPISAIEALQYIEKEKELALIWNTMESMANEAEYLFDTISSMLEDLDDKIEGENYEDFADAIGYKGTCMGNDVTRIVSNHIMRDVLQEKRNARIRSLKSCSKQELINKVLNLEREE